MHKALFLYSDATGQGAFLKHIEEIKERLRLHFGDLTCHKTSSQEDLSSWAKGACGVYEILILAGGDGSFNRAINAMAEEKELPIIGYINAGTISDIGKSFGIAGSYQNSLNIIEEGDVTYFDVGKINSSYFAYMAAVGAYSDIAYKASRERKKRLGKVAYYTMAAQESMKKKTVLARIVADGKAYTINTPFILLLSGTHVGGFKVNGRGSFNDGKMELYLTKPGLFNGLVHYLFFKMRTLKISASSFSIETLEGLPWCIDGEAGPTGKVNVKTIHGRFRIFYKKK